MPKPPTIGKYYVRDLPEITRHIMFTLGRQISPSIWGLWTEALDMTYNEHVAFVVRSNSIFKLPNHVPCFCMGTLAGDVMPISVTKPDFNEKPGTTGDVAAQSVAPPLLLPAIFPQRYEVPHV